MTYSYFDFDINQVGDNYEVLFIKNNKPRRMALCTHKDDAEHIVESLKYAYANGIIK